MLARRVVLTGVALAALSGAPQVRADSRIEPWPVDRKMKVDGLLREWPGGFSRLDERVKGSGSDPTVSAAVGYDAERLYVAARVTDDEIARGGTPGAGDDHLTLTIAFPKEGRGVATHELALFPGDPGKTPGAARVNGRAIKGAKVVEAPEAGGYTLEAQIPWSVFPEAKRIRVGLRASFRYTDASSPGSIEGVVATTRATGGSMPGMPLAAELGLDQSLLRKERLGKKPAKRAVGDVSGSAELEVVAVYGKYLTIVGSHFREGKEFFFTDLGIESARDVLDLDLVDFTGDGKSEIVLRLIGKMGRSDRKLIRVFEVGGQDEPFIAFQHETGVKTDDLTIENDVDVVKVGGRPAIRVAQGKADGVDAADYAEPQPSDMASTIYPWQAVESRTFGHKDGKWQQMDEKAGSARMDARGAGGTGGGVPDGPPAPPPPRPPTSDELLDRVYALYRKDRSVGAAKPAFDFVTDVAANALPERVLVHGIDLVVFGKAFRDGQSYVYSTLGVKDPEDIKAVTARDITGDGKAEIIVYGVRHTKTSEELGGVVVDREVFLVYKVTETGMPRIFAAETSRSMDGKRIVGAIRFGKKGHATTFELLPGRALGWTKETYPFPEDTAPAGGIEPLLLPWSTTKSRRYEWSGDTYGLK